MRVLHVVSSLDPAAGGVSQAVITIIKGLTEKGIKNEVVMIDPPEVDYLKRLPFPVHACGPGKTAWQYSPALLKWLQQNLQKFDTIVVHGLWQYHTYATYRTWTKLSGIKPKLFLMPHGMLDPYFQRAKGRKLKAIRNWLFWKLIEKKVINSANAVLFTCDTEKILAGENFRPYHPKATKVVGLGVEVPPAFTQSMQETFKKIIGKPIEDYWLFISRIHEKKGVDILLKAYSALKQEGYTLPALVVAGPGLETPVGLQMQALVNKDNNIYFPGMLSGEVKWGAFYGCEVFILPSHQENFGIAVVEALACSKPVLISDQVNIWREIQEGNAAIIAPDTEEGVKKMLKEWFSLSREIKESMQLNALAVYEKNFSEAAASYKMIAALQD